MVNRKIFRSNKSVSRLIVIFSKHKPKKKNCKKVILNHMKLCCLPKFHNCIFYLDHHIIFNFVYYFITNYSSHYTFVTTFINVINLLNFQYLILGIGNIVNR